MVTASSAKKVANAGPPPASVACSNFASRSNRNFTSAETAGVAVSDVVLLVEASGSERDCADAFTPTSAAANNAIAKSLEAIIETPDDELSADNPYSEKPFQSC